MENNNPTIQGPYSSILTDGSDRKSLDILVNKLNALKKTNKNCQESSPKYKQLSIQNFSSPIHQSKISRTTPGRTKPLDKIKNSKVTKKKKISQKQQPSSMMNTWLKKTNPELENVAPKEAKTKEKTTRKIKPKVSDSLEKNNFLSLEYILEYKRKYEKNQAIIDYLTIEMEKPLEVLNLDFSEPEVLEVLDCKHLTDSELKQHYKSNKLFLHEIFHGKTYCSRHESFQHENFANNFTYKDLRFNTSMSSYTYPQKDVLLSLLGKQFPDGGILGKHDQYFFKVLLPELCKKIFMDVHNMSSEEAETYLATGTLKPK